jgi:REP element-mobilizing transposase RayT
MPSRRISEELNTGIYFLTMTVYRWYYLFDRHNRWELLAHSIRFCQKNKGLKLHAYVFMLNHIHLIVASDDVAGFVRDFKKFTSKQFKINLEQTEPQVLSLFIDSKGHYQFWMNTNAPKKIEQGEFYRQKIEYIHNNPVRKNYVVKPEHWLWSSASPNSPLVVTKLET